MRFLASLLIALIAQAPAPTGGISGKVTDSAGGVMPGISIVVTDATGQSRSAVTDGRGQYAISGLTPGVYRAEAQLAGFSSRRTSGLKVIDQATTEWNVSMTVLSAVIAAPASATLRDPTPIELSRSVYTAALGAIRDLSTPATIGAVSLIVPAEFQEDLWDGRLQFVPKDLRAAIAATAAEAVLLNPESLPSFATLATREVPPNGRSRVSLSRAFVAPSGLDALVVYSHWCGNLCGSGAAIWLHRAATTSEWRVAGLRGFWES